MLRVLLSAVLIMSLIPWTSLGAEEGKESIIGLGKVVVTGTKTESPLRDVPASVVVIEADQIDAQNLPNGDVADALRSVSGITLRRAYAPFPAYLNIRGAGSDATVVLVNGITSNWEITQAIPPEMVERIEVLKGPASSLYGANAMGGVVNIITKEAKGPFNAQVGASYGNFDTRRETLYLSGSKGPIGIILSSQFEDSDGTNVVHNTINPSITMIKDCPYSKKWIALNTHYELPTDGKLSVLYDFFSDEYLRGRPNVGGDWDRHLLNLRFTQPLGQYINMKLIGAYRYDDLLHLYDGGGTNYALRQTRTTDYREMPVDVQFDIDLHSKDKLTLGFYNQISETEYVYYAASGSYLYKNYYKSRDLAFYLQNTWKPLTELAITMGARYDSWKNYDIVFENFRNRYPSDKKDEKITGKIGVKYSYQKDGAIWANYGMGFLPPTPEQLFDDRTSGGNPRVPNPDLKPETTNAYELGIEKILLGMWDAKLIGFRSTTKDKIISWFRPDNVWENKNIGKTKSYGIEFDNTFLLDKNWEVYLNYTWNVAKIKENPATPNTVGNNVPFSPKHKANLGIAYNIPDNLKIGAYLRYISEQDTTEANLKYNARGEELFMDKSLVMDLKLTKFLALNNEHIHKCSLGISVDNVFNTNYRTFYMYEDPGRVISGEIKLFLK